MESWDGNGFLNQDLRVRNFKGNLKGKLDQIDLEITTQRSNVVWEYNEHNISEWKFSSMCQNLERTYAFAWQSL